jgi:CheY-like chemotaxis protein
MDKILVIDDEEGIRFSLCKVLTHLGYTVKVARDGEEGIELFSNGNTFDLVITGICMPRRSGNEVAEYIRGSDKSDTPMVAMSGSPKEEINRGLFNCLLIKPFRMESLVDVVRSLAKKQLKMQTER